MRLPVLVLALAALAAPLPAAAADIQIMHPWARPSLPDRPAAGYLGIHNNGAEDDRLTGVRVPGADSAELHATVEADGVVRMEPLDAIEVPSGGMAHLGPGGTHLMIFGLEDPLSEGDELPVTLIFDKAGEIEAQLQVTAEPSGHGMQGHGQDHGSHDDHGTTD